jgi:hypothetical protein
MAKNAGLIVVVLILLAVPLCAQDQDTGDGEAEEYTEEEFSPSLRNLRRAEIVMLGSFPLTLFVSLEFYDIYRYVSFRGDPDQYRYAPWPFRPPDAAGYSATENLGIFVSALSVSFLIAVADYIVGRVRERRPER